MPSTGSPEEEFDMTVIAHRTPPLVYVECDIPEGLTLVEWRRGRFVLGAQRPTLATTVRRSCGLGR
jgi:hypothetical protein